MAEIKMDISEYEEMKKNARLLEESLERERKQSDTIEKLKEERIAALEENSKKVTTITEVVNKQYVLKHREDSNYNMYIKSKVSTLLRSISRAIRDNDRGYLSTQNFNSPTDFRSMLEQDVHEVVQDLVNSYYEIVALPTESFKTVNTKGLDEVILDLKEQLHKELEEEIEKSIKSLEVVQKKLKEVETKEKDAIALLATTEQDLEKAIEENNLLEELLEANKQALAFAQPALDFISSVEKILNAPTPFMGSSKKLKDIQNLLDNYNKEKE